MRTITVAQIRGNGLSDRETKTWEFFPKNIAQTVFKTTKNIYYQSPLPFKMVTVRSSADNFFTKNFFKYLFGRYQQMFGLEKKLAGFDVAHVGELYNFYTTQAVRAKKLNPKLKVVATVWENSFGRFEYNYWPGFSVPPRYWRQKLASIMQENIAGVDMFIPATNDAADLLRDAGVPDSKITVVTPGIIPAPAGAKAVLPEIVRDKEIYLVVNRLVKEKGVYDVLYGWRIYLSKQPKNHDKVLLIVGEGPEKKNMMRLVEEWGMNNTIIFIPQVPYSQVLGLYQQARCLILGSIPQTAWQEQFGYVLGEAIGVGTPIIATYCGAIEEVVGEAGILVPPAHPIALAKALHEIDKPTVYARLKAGCDKEKAKFNAQTYANTVAHIYESLTA